MGDGRTVIFKPRENPDRSAVLILLDTRNKPIVIPMRGSMTIGRVSEKSSCDICVCSRITGRRHGEFLYHEISGEYYYRDYNSMNGTYVNGRKLEPGDEHGTKACRLKEGDILRIDKSRLDEPHPESVLMIFTYSYAKDSKWISYTVKNGGDIPIGRGKENAVILDDMMVSQTHAVIRQSSQGWWIEDMQSQNGVRVNGWEVYGRCPLHNHDTLFIGNTLLILWYHTIIYNYFGEQEGRLSVNIRKKDVNFGRKTLLKDICFEAESTDFVLILGGSGAGKTTLINAILGEKKADGEILLDGQDLYKNFKNMKTKIGLVPQFLNLRLSDKVRETLMDAAQIKLHKRDYSKEDKKRRVQEVMEKVGVQNLSEQLISQLSGGQKKKVSVAVQLIGFQQVFICDEPDSGLDAASRKQQMEILKEIADNGKIVMVISHEPDDAVDSLTGNSLFTKVLVIAKSAADQCGHMAFYGGVEEAKHFFGVNRLQDIMLEINPKYEGGKGKADYYIQNYNRMHR